MSATDASDASIPSRTAVTLAEGQVIARRERLRTLAAGIRRKGHARIASAGMLIVAFGAGVALEQIKRRRSWRLVSVLSALNTVGSLVNVATAWMRPSEPGAQTAVLPTASSAGGAP